LAQKPLNKVERTEIQVYNCVMQSLLEVQETTKPTPLTLKEELFCIHFTNHGTHTYGNRTRSYELAYTSDNIGTCGVEGCKLLKKPRVAHRINQIEETKNYGLQSRNAALREIIMGTHVQITSHKTTHKDENGDVTGSTEKEVLKTPSAAQTTQAIKEANKVSGVYEQNKAVGSALSKALGEVFKSAVKTDNKTEDKTIKTADNQETDSIETQTTDNQDSSTTQSPSEDMAGIEVLGGNLEPGGRVKIPPHITPLNFPKVIHPEEEEPGEGPADCVVCFGDIVGVPLEDAEDGLSELW